MFIFFPLTSFSSSSDSHCHPRHPLHPRYPCQTQSAHPRHIVHVIQLEVCTVVWILLLNAPFHVWIAVKALKALKTWWKRENCFPKKYHRMYSSWWLPTQWMLKDSSKITSGVREALLLWLFITWNISIYWLLFSLHIFTDFVFDSLLLNRYAVCFACLKEGSKSTSETFTLSSLTANDLWQNTVLLFHSSYTFTSILIDNPPPSSALKYFSKIFHLSNHLITVFHFVMGISTDDHFYFPCTLKACSKEPLLVPRPVN